MQIEKSVEFRINFVNNYLAVGDERKHISCILTRPVSTDPSVQLLGRVQSPSDTPLGRQLAATSVSDAEQP